MTLLEVKGLRTYFFTRYGVAKAVDGVSFVLDEGETLGLVGESGCGKTITSLSILRLVPRPAGKIVAGEVLLDGEDLLSKGDDEMVRYRGKYISMILQDPMSSLNPVLSIRSQLTEAISLHHKMGNGKLIETASRLLQMVGIVSAGERLSDFPHQFSGGMRQRVVGAIALACHPKVLIADEPTTSLDATTQLQYLEMLREIQGREHTALIFITHDIGIVAKMCSRVAVMYAGRIVEIAPTKDIFDAPAHPYTSALMRSVPNVAKRAERLYAIPGEPPALHRLPFGCSFSPRCAQREPKCREEAGPPEVDISSNHMVRCWKYV